MSLYQYWPKGEITVFAFLDSVTGISPIDGKGRVGLPFKGGGRCRYLYINIEQNIYHNDSDLSSYVSVE